MSARDLPVYTVTAAEPTTARWFNDLIRPALAAVKADGRPIEFRPLGRWAGMAAAPPDLCPDGRISLAKTARFYSKTQFVCVYVHELAHCLLDEVETDELGKPAPGLHGHDAAFLALNMSFLLRLDAAEYLASARATSWLNYAGLYDFGDSPEALKHLPDYTWRPLVLAWSLQIAAELAPTSKTAVELASEVCARFWAWCDALAAEPHRQAEKVRAKKLARENELLLKREQQNNLMLWRGLAGLFFLGFASLIWLGVRT